MPGFEYTEQ